MRFTTLNKGFAFAAGASLALGLATPSMAGAPESDDPILLVLNNWTSQVVLANVTATLLRDMGATPSAIHERPALAPESAPAGNGQPVQ